MKPVFTAEAQEGRERTHVKLNGIGSRIQIASARQCFTVFRFVRSDKGEGFEQFSAMTFRQLQPMTTEYEDALRLRDDILRKPLGLVLTEADRARDSACFHLGGFEGTRLAAVLLLQPLDGRTLQMRQVAVRREQQGSGVGSKLIAFAEEFARQRSYATIIAHARASAVEFYRRFGYAVSDEEFIEVTIPHRLVTKTLSALTD